MQLALLKYLPPAKGSDTTMLKKVILPATKKRNIKQEIKYALFLCLTTIEKTSFT